MIAIHKIPSVNYLKFVGSKNNYFYYQSKDNRTWYDNTLGNKKC